MINEPVVKEVTLNAPVSKVWKALTDKNEMKNWYSDIKDYKPKVGYSFKFYGDLDGKKIPTSCIVKEVEKGKKIAYTWSYDEYPAITTVTFGLINEGDKTTVRLTHEGLERIPTEDAGFSRESHQQGWENIIGTSLKEYLEK
jgi:uncharacterized protein YndB with AHSA1/START domain